MNELWREWLYPLGFLSALAFTARFLVQWISSELKQKSTVTPLFWQLSLAGNLLLILHSVIQIQFHIAFVQTCNGIISWRNLNLMDSPSKRRSFQATAGLMASALLLLITAFAIQSHWLGEGVSSWFRIPLGLNQEYPQAGYAWHFLGFAGLLLFNSRFWIQWWHAERLQSSVLGPSFWWMSFIGDLLCLAYFLRIFDLVNLAGPAFGLIPYLRNLMLIYRPKDKHLSANKSATQL
jgi:lipid-A-disaccharide synthase-like uncharacterized protein